MAAPPMTREDLRGTLPDMSRSLTADGLDDSIEILRDVHGIPHVRARSYHDAFFGQGFATAQDRLWHMDHDRHLAYGRWAEYAGAAAVEQDLAMRRLQISPSVDADYAALNPEARTMLDAYAAGVNAFIEGPDPLPVEYGLLDAVPEPWRPWDCLAVFQGQTHPDGGVRCQAVAGAPGQRVWARAGGRDHPRLPEGAPAGHPTGRRIRRGRLGTAGRAKRRGAGHRLARRRRRRQQQLGAVRKPHRLGQAACGR